MAVDYYFSIGPWGAIIGAALGFTVGLTHLIYLSQQKDEGADKPPKSKSGTP